MSISSAFSGRHRIARGVLYALLLIPLLLAFSCSGPDFLGGRNFSGVGPPPSGALSVSFIDVGQGDAVLVQAGGEDYLVDAGNPEEGPVVVDFLRERGVDDLEGMVSTSGDADHVGGLAEVLEAFPVEKVYLSGYPKDTLTYAGFLRAVRAEEGVEVERVRAGHRTEWGGVRVDVLNPPPGGFFSGSNDNSVALLLTYGRARVLLGGDAEQRAEEYMASGPYTGPLTVLKVNHHGSETSTGPLFLSRFRPRVAVIQCGRDNPYGHPDPEVLERLRRAGARVFRTDLHGDVIVTIRRDLVEVAVERPVRAGA
ncbi:hypothetical protein RxyAA322_23210 [Rubrobacter xylanophilus]|uniref:Metallo-beta-lactamase domain-containing protein n=1 Tax=Rubrobacter xylanophilus TaxID=49319 RepID=A0A510HP55_9ACTN|nr:hypothetical protein RxyAA322_23210 [Rubrobacter xylanophilus]